MKGVASRRGYATWTSSTPMKTPLRSLALIALSSAWLTAARAADLPAPVADTGYTPCKIHQTVSPVFPPSLLASGIHRGEVQLTFEVGPLGRLGDTLVTAYTHREFADEALRAVKQWRFEPGVSGGQPVISILNFTFNFETTGVVAVAKYGKSLADPVGSGYAYQAHGVATLDLPPIALNQPGPVYPKAWIEQGRTGSVVIDFFIDETGQARLPVNQSHTDEVLAASAIAAVAQWRFEPPTLHGHPVLVRAQQTFDFKPEPKSERSS